MNRANLIPVAALFIAFTYAAGAIEHSYQLKGKIYFYENDASNLIVLKLQRDYQVSVGQCSWRIETYGISSSGQAVKCITGTTNGSDIYHVSSFTNGTSSGVTESGPFPLRVQDAATTFLWSMFCSGCFYSSNQATGVPFYDNVVAFKSYELPMKVTLAPSGDHLVQEITFFSDGLRRSYHMQKRDFDYYEYSPPHSRGFTGAVLRATEVCNINGRGIPCAFDFEEYAPALAKVINEQILLPTAQDLTVKRRVTAKSESCQELHGPFDFIPSVNKRVVVNDFRLAEETNNVGAVGYYLEQPQWTSKEQAQDIHLKQLQRRQVTTTAKVPFGIIVLALIVPLGVIFLLKKESARIRQYFRRT